jgi:hypothetical protein
MSISPIVDANYRILPEDLEGIARHVIVANVTYQGVEEMAPVLHFAGQTKRLVLSAEQVGQMIEITGTTLFPQWVGVAIILQPHVAQNGSSILIKAVTAKMRGQPMPVYVSEDRRGWIMALSVVGLLLSSSIIFAALNITTILAAIQQLRDIWPLR